MIIGTSIPWYEMPCSYGTAINDIPQNVWFSTKDELSAIYYKLKRAVHEKEWQGESQPRNPSGIEVGRSREPHANGQASERLA